MILLDIQTKGHKGQVEPTEVPQWNQSIQYNIWNM